jgi:hypothetical protein
MKHSAGRRISVPSASSVTSSTVRRGQAWRLRYQLRRSPTVRAKLGRGHATHHTCHVDCTEFETSHNMIFRETSRHSAPWLSCAHAWDRPAWTPLTHHHPGGRSVHHPNSRPSPLRHIVPKPLVGQSLVTATHGVSIGPHDHTNPVMCVTAATRFRLD